MISLKELLQTPRFSDLKLLTDQNKLTNQKIDSVEITETPDVEKFIPENVLILTTAMVFQDQQEELRPFIDSLVRANAIGLGIKVGRFLNHIEADLIAYANELNFPLIIIADHYPLGSLLHQIMSEVLETEREEIDFALDIQKRFSDLLVQDASNDLLVNEFSRMIKSPIILLDPFGQIIARSPQFKNHKQQAEYYVTSAFDESRKKQKEHGSFIVEESDGSKTHLSLIEIDVHSYYPHYLVIIDPEKVPYPTSIFAFEQAALVFQFNLYKNQKVDESLYANEAHFFNDLLNSQIQESFMGSNFATVSRTYGYVQTDYYQVIHISSKDILREVNPSNTLKTNEKLFLSYRWIRQHLEDYFENALVIWRDENNEIVVVLQNEPTDLSEKLLDISKKIDALITNQLTFSIGYSFEKWHQLEQSYTQAKLAYNERQNEDELETILYYRDNGIEQLFNDLDQNEISYFCNRVLKDLAYPTEDSKIDLRETLDTYLKNQGEITQTSNELFVHRNTVKYRINRCEEMLGVKVDDPQVSLKIRLALQLSEEA